MPIRDAEDNLIAIFYLRVIFTREEDVHRKLSRIGAYKNCRTANLCNTHILFIATLQHPCDSSLGIIARTQSLTLKYNLHAVTLQRVVYITLIYIYIALQLIHLDIGRTRTNHIHHTLVVRQLRCRQLILVATKAIDNTLGHKRLHHIANDVATLLGVATRCRRKLLERELTVGELAEHIYNKCGAHLL